MEVRKKKQGGARGKKKRGSLVCGHGSFIAFYGDFFVRGFLKCSEADLWDLLGLG